MRVRVEIFGLRDRSPDRDWAGAVAYVRLHSGYVTSRAESERLFAIVNSRPFLVARTDHWDLTAFHTLLHENH